MESQVYRRHDMFLQQRLCPELRRAALRTREILLSTTLPDNCAASLGQQAPATGGVLLQVEPFWKLTSAATLCGLAERCVGAESVGALLADLREVRERLAALLHRGSGKEALERFFPSQEVIADQLRTFVLSAAARDILEVPDVGRVSLDQISVKVRELKWEMRDFSQGSPAAPFLEQLNMQIDELARRLPCTGGGSIPYATQRRVWGWMEVRIIHECIDLVAKLGRRKTREALVCLVEDFQGVRETLGDHFQDPADHPESTLSAMEAGQAVIAVTATLLPDGHPLAGIVSWDYLHHYVEVHCGSATDAVVWSKRHPEYPVRLHKGILEYFFANSKQIRQHMSDLEGYYAGYLNDETCPPSPMERS